MRALNILLLWAKRMAVASLDICADGSQPILNIILYKQSRSAEAHNDLHIIALASPMICDLDKLLQGSYNNRPK